MKSLQTFPNYTVILHNRYNSFGPRFEEIHILVVDRLRKTAPDNTQESAYPDECTPKDTFKTCIYNCTSGNRDLDESNSRSQVTPVQVSIPQLG